MACRICRIAMLSCILLVALIMLLEEKLIYFPERYPESAWTPPEPTRHDSISPRIEDCWFRTDDGLKLHAWYCSPVRAEGDRIIPIAAGFVLLWLHGNAGNVTHRYDMICEMIKLPAEILIIDYRGYGRSEGSPSENGLYLDARAAWHYLIEERRVPPQRIVIFGKSLGGAVAIDLAASVMPAGLIVQSTFTCIADMARQIMPLFPTFILRTKMDSVSKIRRVACPKLFIHSSSDEMVPFDLGRRLYEAAAPPSRFYEVKGAHHNETYLVGGKAYFEALKSFFDSCARSSTNQP